MIFLNVVAHIFASTTFLARAGGGGSGGFSGMNGTSAAVGNSIFFFAAVPAFFLTAALGAGLRSVATKYAKWRLALNIGGWIGVLVVAVLLVYAGKIWGALCAVFVIIGFWVGMSVKTSIGHRTVVGQEIAEAGKVDPVWNDQAMTALAQEVFMRYQADWSSLNTESIRQYTTQRYFNHSSLLIAVLMSMGRRDNMSQVAVDTAEIASIEDQDGGKNDSFIVSFRARAHDQLIDTRSGVVLYTDDSVFAESWKFVRSGETWLLDGIAQAVANPAVSNGELLSLAKSRGYYYSEDMGWLFIPARGQLFGGSRFGTSDINNHIVGLYNNQLLTQVYSYIKDPQSSQKSYVIAQLNVPKQYGEIVVRRKKILQLGINGLQKIETEWTQFNKKYEVYASSAERATSFELLNPTYMEQLEALPFEVNIEVVDNVIYLYTDERGTDVETYSTMLDLLNKAFKEMRL